MENVLGIDGGTYIGFLTCVGMLLFIIAMRSFDPKLRTQFIKLVVAVMISLAAAAVDMYLDTLAEPLAIRYLVKNVKYITQGLSEYFVLLIIIRDHTNLNKKLLLIPFVIASVVVCLAPFSSRIYSFTADNQFIRGPIGNIIFIQAASYIVVTLLACIHKWFDGYQNDATVILFMLFAVCVGVILEEEKIFPNCTMESSIVGVVFLYIYIYAERYNVDSVSRCYKRRCFYSDANRYSKLDMMIISMDLNDLKLINDNYGHKAGDIALLTFAEVVRSVKTNKFILYRTGGDEFMILGIKATEDEAKELVELVKEKLTETPYTCSFGIYPYKPGDDFDAAVVRADKAMYEDKSAYKASKSKRSHSRNDEFESRLETFTNNISFLG
ncbi:MAG: GGDEF domain-containing protein [Pseudobutyrivibrio sp.]|uniref:GGDEF domain-containing protein n=1 Tax=unclassified Pseudobutyrivibrio TaxID=2638619 RepID=UPI0008849B5D|nr:MULTISPECIES: GGDEF domain-containing protein [unclassified Pseudobutyrivibrio]MBE5904939.1 GGDEF domain-containing protein [Pseudobutyrivibrio sp.]SCY14842.1 diguanylate cyclase (GGDEF) domain-containing protein [Pseudobutyrivibrio sp. AR14]